MAKNGNGCTCDCASCQKVAARLRKVHPIFAMVVFIAVIAGAFGVMAAAVETQHRDILELKTEVAQLQSVAKSDAARETGVSYDGVSGQTALELLKKSHQVEVKDYGDLGQMVVAIDGAAADSAHFWGFYIDGQMATEGAANYETKTGQKIEWKLEEIQ